MSLIKLTKNTIANNKEVVKKEKIKKEKKYDDPKVICEDERGKDEYTTHYVLNDGTKKTVISSVPVNYFDEENNTWEEIDNTLEEESDSFVTKKRKFKTEINKTSKGKGVKLSNNKFNVSWYYLGKKNSRTVVENTKLTVNKFDSNNKKRNKNTYENVDINTDLEYVLEGNNIKENIIVKEKSDSYEYNFLFELKGLKVRLSDDKESIEIYNDEKVEFMIPAPFMYDANGNRNDNVYYEIEENGVDSYIFTVVADKEWINSAERVLPVTIDPQIVVDSSMFLTKTVQMKTSNGQWTDTSSLLIRAYRQPSREYRTILKIKKSIFKTVIGNITSVKLILKPMSTISGILLINNKSRYFNSNLGNLEIEITHDFLTSEGDVEIILEAQELNLDFQFVDNVTNPARIEVEYVFDEHLQSTIKTFDLANCAMGDINLVTGEMVTLFPLVEARNSALGIPIDLINKIDSTNYYLGNNFRLNLHEKVVKYDSDHYIYTDSNGRKHAFRKFYYYLESKVKHYVSRENLVINNDGTILFKENYSKEIKTEYKSTNGYKLITNIEDIDNVEYIEQRSDEIRDLEESLNSFVELFKQYVIVESIPLESEYIQEFANYFSTKERFELFLEAIENLDDRLLLTKSDFTSYFSSFSEFDSLSDIIEKKVIERDTFNPNDINYKALDDEIAEYNIKIPSLQVQINWYKNYSKNNIEQLKKHYKQYCVLLDQLEKQKQITPVMFLTDGTYTKGYNEKGNLVLIYDKYGKYAVVEYSKTYTSESTYIEKIVRLYDSLGKQVSFIYNDNGILSEIKDIRGESIYLKAIENGLEICSNTVNSRLLNEEKGRIYKIDNISQKISSEILYQDNKISMISTLSNVTNLSLNTESTLSTPECISKINFAYEYHDSLMVKETVITKDLINEKYEFDESGFNTYYYLEENGLVVIAQRYIHQPYYRGDIKQEYTGDTAKIEEVNTKKETLYKYSLSDFMFDDGDSVTTTLNMFEQPLQKYTNAVAIANDCTKTSTIDYTYDQEQKLIEEKETVTFSKDLKTFITYKKYTYDLHGNIVKTETYVEGEELTNGKNITENIFDENGNLVKSFSYNTLDPSTKFYNESLYNESGQVVSKLDSLGVNTTEYKYLNNLVSEEVLPNGSRFGYGYDNSGNLISVTQSTDECEENSNQKVYKYGSAVGLNSNNNHIEYTYDYKRRVTRVSLDGVSDYARISYAETLDSNDVVTQTSVTKTFNGKTHRREYKWNGNIISFWKDNSLYLTYEYDNKERLIKLSDTKRGNNFNYTYDDYDNLICVFEKTNYNTTPYLENISYNSFGLVELKNITNCVNHLYNYSYSNDSKMNLSTITFNTNTKINLKYDINGRRKGRVVSIGDKVILDEEISYLKIGDHSTLIPSGIKYKGTSDNLRYSYDNMGNINKVYVNGELAVRYTYDALNRLIREDNKVLNETILISYDSNGNIINKRVFDYTLCDYYDLEAIRDLENYDNYTYIYDGDKLVSINDDKIVCEYDENTGQLLSYKGEGISWDHDKISSIGQTYIYYDNFGRRESIGMLSFIYDSNNRIIKQNNGLEFFYDNNGIAGFIYDSDIYIYRKNILGDITDIIDSNGNIIVKYVYDAWGNHKVCNPDGTENTEYLFVGNLNPFRYRGYYYDVETGLFWCNSRYYNPEWGRWISPDSIEYLDPQSINGLNLYAYCGNDPANRYDPSGHAWYNTLWDWANTMVGLLNPMSTLTAIGSVVYAVIDGRINDVVADLDNGCFNPFNQDESIALNSLVFSFYKGESVVRHSIPKSSSLQIFGTIFLNSNKIDDSNGRNSLKHEWGHGVQERFLGFNGYMTFVAIPSVINYWFGESNYKDNPSLPYNPYYFTKIFERTADYLGGVSRVYAYNFWDYRNFIPW